jgi:hypothetical protein
MISAMRKRLDDAALGPRVCDSQQRNTEWQRSLQRKRHEKSERCCESQTRGPSALSHPLLIVSDVGTIFLPHPEFPKNS